MVEKKTIWEFLKKNELCALATASTTGKTEAAVMAYVIKDDFSMLLSTEITTRKYQNIAANKQVSVIVGGFDGDPSIQIDGLIRELAAEEATQAKSYILTVHPQWKDYFNSPASRFFEIKPGWLRWSDFTKDPPETMEMSDFSQ